jgi:DNA-binding GntR family transcriptional regulator
MNRLRPEDWSAEIDPFSPQPLHHQMTEILVSQLSRDMVSVGDVLPREEELADHFQISRNTIRRAYAELEADGWIERKAGRGTTLVRKPLDAMPTYLINPEQGLGQILELSHGCVVRRCLKTDSSAPPEVATFFGPQQLTAIEEDALVGGRRVGMYTWWIPTTVVQQADVSLIDIRSALADGFPEDVGDTATLDDDQQGNLSELLSTASITTLIMSRRANRRQAKAFELGVRAPLLEVHYQLESADSTPIAYAVALWQANEIGFRLVSHATGQAIAKPREVKGLQSAFLSPDHRDAVR